MGSKWIYLGQRVAIVNRLFYIHWHIVGRASFTVSATSCHYTAIIYCQGDFLNKAK
jgi:hypothetical protein